MTAILVFQNFGFANSRFLVLLLLFLVVLVISRKAIKIKLSEIFLLLIVNPFLTILLPTDSVVFIDALYTTVYSLAAYFLLIMLPQNERFEKVALLLILGFATWALFKIGQYQPNFFVRKYHLSGGDNRFAALIIVILYAWILYVGIKNHFLVKTCIFALVILGLSFAGVRGAAIIALILLPNYFLQSMCSPRTYQIIAVITYTLFCVIYFWGVSSFNNLEFSLHQRDMYIRHLFNLLEYQIGYVEPHFLFLSFFQVLNLFAIPAIILLFFSFNPFSVLVCLLAFSFVSEPITQIFLFSIIALERIQCSRDNHLEGGIKLG